MRDCRNLERKLAKCGFVRRRTPAGIFLMSATLSGSELACEGTRDNDGWWIRFAVRIGGADLFPDPRMYGYLAEAAYHAAFGLGRMIGGERASGGGRVAAMEEAAEKLDEVFGSVGSFF